MNILLNRQVRIIYLVSFLLGAQVIISCNKTNSTTPDTPVQTVNYQQTNLVSDLSSYNPAFVDTALVNAWGIAISPTGIFWISANHTGLTTVYDNTGKTKLSPVAIPLHGVHRGGSPTGVVFNSTTDFVEPANARKAAFIYASEDGVVSAWNGGDSTVAMADLSSTGAVFKGIALANDGTGNFLYLADFKNNKIVVLDKTYTVVTNKPFSDPTIPAGFAPFNIKNINGNLYVTYAKQKGPDNKDDLAGPGNGFVNVFSANGILIKRFASAGTLNSPWGLAKTPASFGQTSSSILVGNFGDGRINVYDSTGKYAGQLLSNSNTLSIDGLWEITYENVANADSSLLYFTAGPSQESHGLFGYLKKQ